MNQDKTKNRNVLFKGMKYTILLVNFKMYLSIDFGPRIKKKINRGIFQQ